VRTSKLVSDRLTQAWSGTPALLSAPDVTFVGLPLQADTYARAARAVPGGNVRELETEWRTWLATKSQAPAYPDAAFLAFCKKKAGRKPL